MKRNIFSTLLIVLVILASGCKKDQATDNTAVGLSARLAGADWTATTISAAIINGMLSIKGTTKNLSVLTIEIQDVKQGSTYSLNETSSDFATYSVKTSGTQASVYSSNIGSGVGGGVSITKIDRLSSTVSGTFYFYLSDEEGNGVNFTAGVIDNLKYITIN